ncbi:MAG: hypothetical protein JKY81_05895 [Colwellia sp.]|nr:hypothetical protein [Colwellia sp.]
MKKLTIFLIVAVVFLAYVYHTKNDSNSENGGSSKIESSLVQSIGSGAFSYQSKKFATKKLQKLTIANEQCKERNLDFSSQIQNIHQVLIQALEFELKQGKSERDLLAYSNQYKTFYDGYDDLLLQAKVNIEKEKYNYTSSVDILSDWNGLSVINGFSSLNIPIIVQELKAFGGRSNGLSLKLELESDINKSDIYDLLENSENFNTYLESPLGISGSPVISPSILFVLTATQLDIDEFEQAVSLQTFTVNDVAIAIINNMPIEYLKLLVTQTKSIEDMPLIVQGRYDSYESLADIAASTHNVELLKLLDRHGIQATNEPGIITAMDIAIMNLPSKANAYQNVESFPSKYLDTLNYLNLNGYKAHGMAYQNNNEAVVSFAAPNRRNLQITNVLDPKLRDYLYQIELIDGSYNIHQLPPDNSLVSNAIETMEMRKVALNDKSKSCESIREELLTEEGFADHRETYDLINEIKNNEEYIAERLHEIDPVLVNLWRDSNAINRVSLEIDSNFISLIREGNYQQALDYSASKPLTTQETDTLLISLVQNIEDIAPIWNARVSPKPPSGLFAFRYLDAEKWELLKNEGFDFSIKDKFGNGIFLPSVLNSTTAVEFLLDNGLKPEIERLGLDALDLLLEETYEKGRLNPNLGQVLNEIKSFEPNHYSRVARIKKFFPSEYEKLIKINKNLELVDEVKINRFRLSALY